MHFGLVNAWMQYERKEELEMKAMDSGRSILLITLQFCEAQWRAGNPLRI